MKTVKEIIDGSDEEFIKGFLESKGTISKDIELGYEADKKPYIRNISKEQMIIKIQEYCSRLKSYNQSIIYPSQVALALGLEFQAVKDIMNENNTITNF